MLSTAAVPWTLVSLIRGRAHVQDADRSHDLDAQERDQSLGVIIPDRTTPPNNASQDIEG